jgi:hypothetical protein
MTKYLVFINDPKGNQKNEPGSREEMACEIAQVVGMDSLHKDYYIAFPVENPKANFESIKELAKCSVEIDDRRADMWLNEIHHIRQQIDNLDNAMSDAYSMIYDAVEKMNSTCKKSKHFKNIKIGRNFGLDHAFEQLDNTSEYDVISTIEEIFEVENLGQYYSMVREN